MKCQTLLLKKFFGLKGAVYYEAIAMVIFSHVKMSSFRTKAHLVFHCCLISNNVKYLMSAGLIFLDMHTRLTLGIVPCSYNFWVCVNQIL